jgi:murein tripeptide amidase MpaA
MFDIRQKITRHTKRQTMQFKERTSALEQDSDKVLMLELSVGNENNCVSYAKGANDKSKTTCKNRWVIQAKRWKF